MNVHLFFGDICDIFKKRLSKTHFLCYTVIVRIKKHGGYIMSAEYSIPLTKIEQEFNLERITVPENYDSIKIETPEVNRPGLALTGFYEIFEKSRISLIGNAEHRYLLRLEEEDRKKKITDYINARPIAVIFTSELPVFEELIAEAAKLGVPVLRSKEKTSPLMAAMISSLNTHLAPRITRHGVLVEVYGEGLLLLGDSGVGKSETAIELVKRGHRLIADDAVEIKKVSAKTLVGSAPEIIRHYVELRGIGIVDVRRLFGMGAVKESEKIDLVINLEQWDNNKMYDRLGLDEHTDNILGIDVPSITLPVSSGRNLSVVIEVAAMNNRQKRMGYNTAKEFNKRLMQSMGLE